MIKDLIGVAVICYFVIMIGLGVHYLRKGEAE